MFCFTCLISSISNFLINKITKFKFLMVFFSSLLSQLSFFIFCVLFQLFTPQIKTWWYLIYIVFVKYSQFWIRRSFKYSVVYQVSCFSWNVVICHWLPLTMWDIKFKGSFREMNFHLSRMSFSTTKSSNLLFPASLHKSDDVNSTLRHWIFYPYVSKPSFRACQVLFAYFILC
jgi:hypothetical protein